MSYLVEQKVSGKIYVYEATSYWDKEKKQSRQKRTYLGRKDPHTGEIIKTTYSPKDIGVKSVKETGPAHLAKSLSKQVGLTQCLDSVFGSDSDSIQALIMYMLIENGPYYLQMPWAQRSGEMPLSSQTISQLLATIGTESGRMDEFFREWNGLLGHQDATYMDITSLSSYSNTIDFLEWGYNRDKESLTQMNVGVLIGEPSGLPVMYRVYPGSIADVSTLEKTLIIGKEQYGLDAGRLIMDRGFYSQHNLKHMHDGGYQFVVPLPFSVGLARGILSDTKTALQSPMEAFSYEDEAYFYVFNSLEIAGIPLHAHIYLNEGRRANNMASFMRRLSDLEAAISEQTVYSIPMAKEFLDSHMRYSSTLFDLSYDNESVTIKRRRNVLSRWMNRFGKMIILTNDSSLSKQDVLHYYRRKDCVEKYYDTLKNTLNQSRLRVHSQATAEGHLFITFLTSILYMALSARMKQADLFKSYSIPELFARLKTVRSVSIVDGPTLSTEIPKKIRTVLQKLSVPLP